MAARGSGTRFFAARAHEHRRCSGSLGSFLRGGFAAVGAFAAVLATGRVGGAQGIIVALGFTGWPGLVRVFVFAGGCHALLLQAFGSSTSWATLMAGDSR